MLRTIASLFWYVGSMHILCKFLLPFIILDLLQKTYGMLRVVAIGAGTAYLDSIVAELDSKDDDMSSQSPIYKQDAVIPFSTSCHPNTSTCSLTH